MAPTIAFLSSRGIPVIGHVGLTPQAVNVLGGYGARGREERKRARFWPTPGPSPTPAPSASSSKACSRRSPAKSRGALRRRSSASAHPRECDGQVLVTDDMLGMFERTPRFVKRYDDLASRIGEAARLMRRKCAAQLPDLRPDLSREAVRSGELGRHPEILRLRGQPLDGSPPASVHRRCGRKLPARSIHDEHSRQTWRIPPDMSDTFVGSRREPPPRPDARLRPRQCGVADRRRSSCSWRCAAA